MRSYVRYAICLTVVALLLMSITNGPPALAASGAASPTAAALKPSPTATPTKALPVASKTTTSAGLSHHFVVKDVSVRPATLSNAYGSVGINFTIDSDIDMTNGHFPRYRVTIQVFDRYNRQVANMTAGYFREGAYTEEVRWNGKDNDGRDLSDGTYRIVVTAEYTYYLYDREWGGTGIAPGKFNNPVGIAFDDEYEYIYVVDFGNNRIQVFASDGTFRRQWGTEGSANGMLDGPIDIAIDDGGKVYVTEKFNQRIQRFNRQGQYQEKWSTLQPFGIDVAPGGTIYNTNGANMVVEWGPDGAARSYEGFAHPYGIAASDDGCVYVANALADQVLLLRQTSDGLLRWHSSSANTGLFDRVSLDYPCGVAVGPEGDVFVADTLNNRIVKLDWCLNFGSTFGSEGDGPAEFNRPMGIAVGSDGSVYVTDTDNDRVQKFVPRAYSANNSTTVTLSRGITQAAYNVALTKPVTKGTMPFLVSSALARGENEMASPGKAYAALDVTQAGMPAIVAVPYDRNATATPLPVLYHSKDSPKPGDKNQTPIPLMLMMGDMNATATPSAKATATGTPGTATPTPNVIPSGPDNATFPDSGANSSTAPGPTDKSATGTPLPTTVGSEGAWLLAMLSLAIIAFAFSLYGGAKRK